MLKNNLKKMMDNMPIDHLLIKSSEKIKIYLAKKSECWVVMAKSTRDVNYTICLLSLDLERGEDTINDSLRRLLMSETINDFDKIGKKLIKEQKC